MWNEIWPEFKERIRLPLWLMMLGFIIAMAGICEGYAGFTFARHFGNASWIVNVVSVLCLITMTFGQIVMLVGFLSYTFPELQKYLQSKPKV